MADLNSSDSSNLCRVTGSTSKDCSLLRDTVTDTDIDRILELDHVCQTTMKAACKFWVNSLRATARLTDIDNIGSNSVFIREGLLVIHTNSDGETLYPLPIEGTGHEVILVIRQRLTIKADNASIEARLKEVMPHLLQGFGEMTLTSQLFVRELTLVRKSGRKFSTPNLEQVRALFNPSMLALIGLPGTPETAQYLAERVAGEFARLNPWFQSPFIGDPTSPTYGAMVTSFVIRRTPPDRKTIFVMSPAEATGIDSTAVLRRVARRQGVAQDEIESLTYTSLPPIKSQREYSSVLHQIHIDSLWSTDDIRRDAARNTQKINEWWASIASNMKLPPLAIANRQHDNNRRGDRTDDWQAGEIRTYLQPFLSGEHDGNPMTKRLFMPILKETIRRLEADGKAMSGKERLREEKKLREKIRTALDKEKAPEKNKSDNSR